MKKTKRMICRLFWLVFSASMFLILGAAMSRPLNNLIPGRIAVYTMVWVIFFGCLWLLFILLEKKTAHMRERVQKIMKYGVWVYLVLFGGGLFAVSCLLRCGVFTDYENVYTAALSFARGEEVANWDYFSRWYNNIGNMQALSLIFFLGSWLPRQLDIYYFALLFNVLQVVLVVYCLYFLAGKFIKGHPVAAPLMALAVCTVWIPFWANTSVFYSDQLSLGAGVFGVALLVKARRKRNWFFYAAAAGIMFGCGAVIKVTSATIMIALAIGCFLYQSLWDSRRQLAAALVSCLAVMVLFSAYCRSLPTQEELKVPVEYWFALGLYGNGTYAESEEFAVRCVMAESREERKEIARERIEDQIDNLWNGEHIIGKARQNFGCGDMGAAGYLLFPYQENILWHWFSMDGDYYWKYACLSTSFLFSVFFFMGAGGLLQFAGKGEGGMEEAGFFVPALAFWGLCLFLMLWEAQDKQLYNHSGWVILSMLSSLNLISGRIKKRAFFP